MTAANGFMYSIGAKNSFQGTGVWSFIKMERKGAVAGGGQGKEGKDCEACEVKMMKPTPFRLHDPKRPALKDRDQK